MVKTINLFPSPKQIRRHSGLLREPQEPEVTLSTDSPKNGYSLSIASEGIAISATTPAAAYHAQVTLKQILNQHPKNVPCLEIEDWPDLEVRGYMLDISRCKVPSQKSLFELIDLLASLKYNQLQLYTEHTFAYKAHQQVWQDSSPLSPQDIQELDAYCSERFIELVPNQNSFGHMERWLRHPDYHHLAESPNGFEHPISGWKQTGSTLKPTQESANFADSLFAELLPNFTSRQLNIGGDEPWELGQGFSKDAVEQRGKTRVYLDHLLRIQKKVQNQECKTQFWGDIIINEPELAKELGNEVTALLWGYEIDHPFESQCKAMKAAGTDFIVVPGTSTWNSIGGRLYTALPNIDAAAKNAHTHQAKGLLLTDWGDNGHHQSHLLSILPILQTAERSWNRTSAQDPNLEFPALNLIPNPLSTSEYNSILRLSQIAGSFKTYLHNSSWLNKILFSMPNDFSALSEQLSVDELETARDELKQSETAGELELARKLLLHAAEKGIDLIQGTQPQAISLDLIEEFRKNWLLRNRPGGLDESVAHFSS